MKKQIDLNWFGEPGIAVAEVVENPMHDVGDNEKYLVSIKLAEREFFIGGIELDVTTSKCVATIHGNEFRLDNLIMAIQHLVVYMKAKVDRDKEELEAIQKAYKEQESFEIIESWLRLED